MSDFSSLCQHLAVLKDEYQAGICDSSADLIQQAPGDKIRRVPRSHRPQKSRFGPKDDRPFKPVPGALMDIPFGFSRQNVEQLLKEQRLEDLAVKVHGKELELGDSDIRPPSPPPIFDRYGVKINNREQRTSRAMVDEYNKLCHHMFLNLEGYVPPNDYRPPRYFVKVFFPIEKFPHINFSALVIGARGVTHKQLQIETGCKIYVRGRGMAQDADGKQHQPDSDLILPPHCHIEAESEDLLPHAESIVHQLVDPSAADFQDRQMKAMAQLANLQGTSSWENEKAMQLAETGGKEVRTFRMADVKCEICGDRGHVSFDCKLQVKSKEELVEDFKMDNEINNLMAEISKSLKKPVGRHCVGDSKKSNQAHSQSLVNAYHNSESTSRPACFQQLPSSFSIAGKGQPNGKTGGQGTTLVQSGRICPQWKWENPWNPNLNNYTSSSCQLNWINMRNLPLNTHQGDCQERPSHAGNWKDSYQTSFCAPTEETQNDHFMVDTTALEGFPPGFLGLSEVPEGFPPGMGLELENEIG